VLLADQCRKRLWPPLSGEDLIGHAGDSSRSYSSPGFLPLLKTTLTKHIYVIERTSIVLG
jgi:hypothetical protein